MGAILVTGGSGFIASHVILKLLEDGHTVRATLRNPAREGEVHAMLAQGGYPDAARLSFVPADLDKDDGWAAAVEGCDDVHHVASPFPVGAPQHEDELIRPAREGTLRVLRAARDAGVRRVVLTSSFAAVGYGHPARARPFDETDWTDPDGGDVQPYMKSKTLAERAAWDFMAREGGSLELAVVNPVAVFGPTLGPDLSTSVMIVKMLMDGAIPVCPRISFGVVDVRDVADLHLRAMADPAARGQRFIATAGASMSLHEIAQVLRQRMGRAARRAPRLQIPDWLVHVSALFNPQVREALPHLGIVRHATSDKARRLLGWHPRSPDDALVATAESLVRLHLLKWS
jgi:dihydroflavonol-4-reductase